MRLNSAYVNEQLIHILLFSPYNLVIKDYSNLEKFKDLFSIIDGYHFEPINLSEYEDTESLEKVVQNLKDTHEKVIVAFSNLRTEFIPDIIGAEEYRYILLAGSDEESLLQISEYTGNNLLTYSVKHKTYSPSYSFNDLEYPHFILDTLKTEGIDPARKQIRALFNFTKKVFDLYTSGRKEDLKIYLLQMGLEQLKNNIPQIESVLYTYFGVDVVISEDGNITEKFQEPPTPTIQKFQTVEEEFGIAEPKNSPIPVTSNKTPTAIVQIPDADEFIFQEKFEDVKKDLQGRVDDARKEYMSVMRRVNGEFIKTLNHAIREHREKHPTVIENPNQAIELYCELRCNSWYTNIPESILVEMLTYHVKNLMKVQKISLEDPTFDIFLEVEQDKFLEAIVELPHESLHLQTFIDAFTNKESPESTHEDLDIVKEVMQELQSGEEYIQKCIKSGQISNLSIYKKSILELLRTKGKG